jgi:hypothetical protein
MAASLMRFSTVSTELTSLAKPKRDKNPSRFGSICSPPHGIVGFHLLGTTTYFEIGVFANLDPTTATQNSLRNSAPSAVGFDLTFSVFLCGKEGFGCDSHCQFSEKPELVPKFGDGIHVKWLRFAGVA